MKFVIKALAGALALAAFGQASAQAFTPVNGNDDLLLTVWDSSLSNTPSYTLDLGISIQQFLATDSTSQLLGSPTSIFSATGLSGDATLSWNLIGTGTSGTSNISVLATNALPGITNNALAAQLADENVFINAILANSTVAGYEATTNSTAGNNYGGTYWKTNYNGTITGTSSPSGYGVADDAVLVTQGSGSGVKATATPSLLGTFTLLSDGQVQYTAPSTTPIPAALWLMGSGLVGLFGIGRRRQAA